MQRFIMAFSAVLAVLQPGFALAQSNPLIIDRARADRGAIAPQTAQPSPHLPAQTLSNIKPFTLRDIRIDGTSLPPNVINAALNQHLGKVVDQPALSRILANIAQLYAEQSDIALYTVTLPKQSFKNGVLRLIATEGHIAAVELNGLSARKSQRIAQLATKLLKDRPLKRSTLQRTLSLIRDIPGLQADVQLLPTTAPGALRMVLTLKQKPWYILLSANDQGSNPLGRIQFQAKASAYGLLRQGEETSLFISAPFQVRRFQYVSLSEAMPLNDSGLMLQAVFGYLRTRPKFPYPEGNAKNAQLQLSYPLLRSFDENLNLSAGVDGIDSSNATLGEIIANERIRAARLSAAYAVQTATSAFAINLSLSNGLNIFGARTTFAAMSDTTFKKAALQTSYARLIAPTWVARLRASGQFAFDPLPVSELYGLGGDIARAYPAASAMGDSGAGGSAEIGYLPPRLPKLLKGLEVFAFADGGTTHIRNRLNLGTRDDQLASAGLGVRLPFREHTKIEFAAANGLISNTPGIAPGHWRITFAISTAG